MTFAEFVDSSSYQPFTTVFPKGNAFGATTGDTSHMILHPGTHRGEVQLGLPEVVRTARLQYLSDKTNPILMHLSDGTRLFLTGDEFRRIKGSPQVGQTVTVVLQRRADDRGDQPSQVKSITCH